MEDILDYEQPTSYIVESTDYRDEYETPVLTAGKSFILGHTNETSGIYSNVPVIIFDDFTTDSRLVDFPFKVKSSAMKILQVRQGINIQYVAYFMSITHLVGDTHKRYWISEYSKLSIPLPPLAEQRRIVAEVEKWFALIDELDANKQDLQVAIRQVRAKVLDLAIHGKLVPQDPNDEPAIALLRRITPHFTPSDTSHYQNPPFDIPASWQWVRVSDIAKTITGGTPSKNKPQYYGGTFPFYKPADLDAGRNVIVASEYLSEEGKSISRVIPPNSIAICCIGSIGKCGYLAKECTTNQQINTIVPYTNIFPLLIYYYCCSSFFKQQLVDKSSAITISIVNKSKLEDTLLPLPPLAEQKRIVSEIERIFGVLGTIEENIR